MKRIELSCLGGALALLCIPWLLGSKATPNPAANHRNPVERGKYLVAYGGCSQCHAHGPTLRRIPRPILPPMPWRGLAGLTDEDLRAIYACLRSIKPIENRVPEAMLAGQPVHD